MMNFQNTEPDIYRASTFRMTATYFRMSAETLLREFEAKNEAIPGNRKAIPFYYLISHACELLLKAALLKRNYSTQDLMRRSLRHNLSNLLKELEGQGVVFTERAKQTVLSLSGQHREHILRYSYLMDGNVVYTPEPYRILEMLDELLLATRLHTESSDP